MHGLLCDEDGLDKVGVNTHFTAVRFKTLQMDSPEVHEEDCLMHTLPRLTTCLLEQEIHFLAHWRSSYPDRFAALLDPSCLGERFGACKKKEKCFLDERDGVGALGRDAH